MNILSVPNILQTQKFQSLVSETSTRLLDAQVEASTGEIANLSKALRGDVAQVQTIMKAINDNERYLQSISIAELRYTSVQSTLGLVSETANLLGIDALAAVTQGDQTSLEQHVLAARGDFVTLVNAINTPVSGRALFSGAELSETPISSAEQILTDITALVAGAATAAAAQADIDAYFGAGGAFETTIYQGSATPAPTIEVAPGVRVDPGLTAIDDEIKDVLKNLAIVAVARDAAPLNISSALIEDASIALLDASDAIINLQANLGTTQEFLARLQARNEAETFTLQSGLAALTTRDIFEASAELEALAIQLEAIYVTTARISGLSLTNFLR